MYSNIFKSSFRSYERRIGRMNCVEIGPTLFQYLELRNKNFPKKQYRSQRDQLSVYYNQRCFIKAQFSYKFLGLCRIERVEKHLSLRPHYYVTLRRTNEPCPIIFVQLTKEIIRVQCFSKLIDGPIFIWKLAYCVFRRYYKDKSTQYRISR